MVAKQLLGPRLRPIWTFFLVALVGLSAAGAIAVTMDHAIDRGIGRTLASTPPRVGVDPTITLTWNPGCRSRILDGGGREIGTYAVPCDGAPLGSTVDDTLTIVSFEPPRDVYCERWRAQPWAGTSR